MLAPPIAALQIASSARLSDSSFATGARRFARAIRVVFKVAVFPLWLAENELRSMRKAISRRIDRALNFSAIVNRRHRDRGKSYSESITSTRRLKAIYQGQRRLSSGVFGRAVREDVRHKMDHIALSFGSTGSHSHEPSPLHPNLPNHALTPNVAKPKPYWLARDWITH